MRMPLPSSRAYFRLRLSAFDAIWAALSPLLALYSRDAYILSPKGVDLVLLYCGISFVFSIIAFLAFRLNDGVNQPFSVKDAINIVKAVCVAGFMTALFIFTFTRLQGIPRSAPIVHVFILAGGLITVRALASLQRDSTDLKPTAHHSTIEHIMLIGANDLSAYYAKFIRAYAPDQSRIIGILDDDSSLVGRALEGTPIVASVQDMESTISEFEVHGVKTDQVIISGDETLLSPDKLFEVQRICSKYEIPLKFGSELISLKNGKLKQAKNTLDFRKTAAVPVPQLSIYHKVKRVIDFVVSATIILILFPLFILISLLVLFDVGSPVSFWQQRIGLKGTTFLLYKFRTLRAPIDIEGKRIPDEQRLSWVGLLLRKARLDELPQLFNVLVGDMSLIGPRPLLPVDQPTNSRLRLSVRPGVTGWAQVHGGNLITNEEKGALDDWYVRHTSLWVDLQIVFLTILFILRGEQRSEPVLRQAIFEEQKGSQIWEQPVHQRASVRDVVGASLRKSPKRGATSGRGRPQSRTRPDLSRRNEEI